jgi:hypothetical protein
MLAPAINSVIKTVMGWLCLVKHCIVALAPAALALRISFAELKMLDRLSQLFLLHCGELFASKNLKLDTMFI